jgi:hypothetical protein
MMLEVMLYLQPVEQLWTVERIVCCGSVFDLNKAGDAVEKTVDNCTPVCRLARTVQTFYLFDSGVPFVLAPSPSRFASRVAERFGAPLAHRRIYPTVHHHLLIRNNDTCTVVLSRDFFPLQEIYCKLYSTRTACI